MLELWTCSPEFKENVKIEEAEKTVKKVIQGDGKKIFEGKVCKTGVFRLGKRKARG